MSASEIVKKGVEAHFLPVLELNVLRHEWHLLKKNSTVIPGGTKWRPGIQIV